jgi:limonene-1,2-epoxide hydrolase
MRNEENIRTVETFLNCLRNKELADAPIAEDILFEEPLMGRGTGADSLLAFVGGFLSALSDIIIRRHVSEGDIVATEWEARGEFGIVPVLELFRIQNGVIIEFKAYYDPRPIVG